MPAFINDENNLWISTPTAMGPFKGLQGGAVAGLLVHELERWASDLDLGFAASASVVFLRPTGTGVLQTKPEVIRQGRRVSVLTNSLYEGGMQTAQATVNFIAPVDTGAVRPTASEPHNPDGLQALPPRKAPHGGPWMMDNFEVRAAGDGIVWFRYKDDIIEGMMPLARILGPADWTHGIRRPSEPKLADPNVNLQVAITRYPVGDDIGIRPRTTWTTDGIGLGAGTLLDESGPFAQVMMSVALTPFD